jgi:hypothetical protein
MIVCAVWVKRLALSGPAGKWEWSLPAARVGGELRRAAGSLRDQTVPAILEGLFRCGKSLLSCEGDLVPGFLEARRVGESQRRPMRS